ncbi:MAG: glycosyltransferase family 2 protein [Gammaproteobacteria bacterium]
MATPPISGTIITFNEEGHIEACIASLRRVCADVLVVDSMSTDRTIELAMAAGARVVSQAYAGEGPQRNLTEREARNDWILALDADERLDDEVVAAIQELPLDDPAIAYACNRKSYVGPRWIRGPGFYPDFVTRLYNRTRSAYEPKPGHASVLAPGVRRISGHLLHYTYDSLSDWIAKINWITSRDAQGMFAAGVPRSVGRPAFSAVGAFFRQMFLRGGILRGADGITITMTSMFRSFMKYQKLNELHERQNQPGGQGRISDLDIGRLRDSGQDR